MMKMDDYDESDVEDDADHGDNEDDVNDDVSF